MTLNDRRRALMGSGGSGIDVICGTATVVGTTLTMPIPSGYYYHCYLKSARTIVVGDLQIVHATPFGLYRRKAQPAIGSIERISTNPFIAAFWISHNGDNMTFSCSNKNTAGLLYDGDEWFYIAWKEAD